MTGATFDFENMLCFALYSTTNAMMRDYARSLDELGITYPQLLVLIALWEQDDVTSSDLGEKTLYELNALTPLLKRLDAAGLVAVSVDDEDRRRRRVRLTPAGRKLQSDAKRVFEGMSCKVGLAPEEIEAVLSACRKIKTRLDD